MKKIAIQDANILIDLINTGLFHYCLLLEYQFTTTEIILDELYEAQNDLVQPHISSGKFTVIKISESELVEIQMMGLEDTGLSEQDWSAFYYAEKLNALLLTGDMRLRKTAKSRGIEVCGIFWIMDQLVTLEIISKPEACSFLNDLMKKNKRLPSEECRKRSEEWCGNVLE